MSRLLVCALATTLAACGSSNDNSSDGSAGSAGSVSGTGGTSAGGTGGGTAGTPGTGGSGGGTSGALGLPMPNDGVQLAVVGATIQPGEDIEYCEVIEVPGNPGEELFVSRTEFALTDYSHHLNVRAVVPGTEADTNTNVGDRVLCDNNGGLPYGSGFATIGGTQEPYSEFAYPEGVGFKLFGGQKVLVNYHYLNTSSNPVVAEAAMNFHFAPAGTIDRTFRRFGMYNFGISIAPRSQTSYTMECRMTQDVMVGGLIRHTHQWGGDFHAWFAGGAKDGEFIWTSTDYDRNQGHTFAAPQLVRAGEGFRFECEFDNTTDRHLTFGSKASDEMCILYGGWWVVNPGDPEVGQDCFAISADENNFSLGAPCSGCPDGQLY